MPIPAIIPLAITAAGTLASGINALSQPKLPFSEADIDRLLNLQLNRALADNASATRRRLAAAGLGGSGAINQIISDQASRIRGQFEEQRQRMMMELKRMQYDRSLQAQQNRGQLFNNIAGLGFGLYQLGRPNPFAASLNQLQQLQMQQPSLQPSFGMQTPGIQLPATGYDQFYDIG